MSCARIAAWLCWTAALLTALALAVPAGASTPAAGATATRCAIQAPVPPPPFSAADARIQDLALEGNEAPAAHGPGTSGPAAPARPPALVGSGGLIAQALGSQYDNTWFDDASAALDVGLDAGALDAEAALRSVDQAIAGAYDSEDAAFLEAHTQVIALPYTSAELQADQAQLSSQLDALFGGAWSEGGVESIGVTVGEFAGPDSSGPWPQVVVKLDEKATDADCEAILAVTETYGTAVTLWRTDDSGVAEAVAAIEPAHPRGSSTVSGEPPAQDQSEPVPEQVLSKPITAASSGPSRARIGLTAKLLGARLRLHVRPPSGRAARVRLTVESSHARHAGRLTRTLRVPAGGSTLKLRLPRAWLRSAARLTVRASCLGRSAIPARTLTLRLR